MGTSDVRLDPKLNQAIWARGIKTVPHRLRVKLESAVKLSLFFVLYSNYLVGKRNDEEGAKERLYTYASHVPVISFKVCELFLFLLLDLTIALFRPYKPRLLTQSDFVSDDSILIAYHRMFLVPSMRYMLCRQNNFVKIISSMGPLSEAPLSHDSIEV